MEGKFLYSLTKDLNEEAVFDPDCQPKHLLPDMPKDSLMYFFTWYCLFEIALRNQLRNTE